MLPLVTVSAFRIRYQKSKAGGTNLKNITLNFLFCHEYIIPPVEGLFNQGRPLSNSVICPEMIIIVNLAIKIIAYLDLAAYFVRSY
jgi:hypothetical protein